MNDTGNIESGESDYFTMRHLWLKYLPIRGGILFVLLVVVSLFMENKATLFLLIIMFSLSIGVELRKYNSCWKKHREFTLRYGDKYKKYFRYRVEKDGFEVLVSSYFADVKPPF